MEKVLFRSTKELTTQQSLELSSLIKISNEHPEFSGTDFVSGEGTDVRRVVVINDDNVVGFMTPRKDGIYWRTGAIFANPRYKGMGYMRAAIEKFFSIKRPGKAWIANNNIDSIRAFTKAGFKRGNQRNLSDKESDLGHDYYLQ